MKLDNIYKEEKKSAIAKLSEIIITMASRPSGLIGLSILLFHISLLGYLLYAQVRSHSQRHKTREYYDWG